MTSARIAHDGALADRHGKGHTDAGLKRGLPVALDAQHSATDVDLIVDDVAEEGDVDDGTGEPVLARRSIREPDRLWPDHHRYGARSGQRLRGDRGVELMGADPHARDAVTMS